MSDARHRSLRNGGLGDGLHRGEKIAIAGGGWRFGEPPPDAQAVPPEAHESLGSRKTVAEVPLTGLSLKDVIRPMVLGFKTTEIAQLVSMEEGQSL